MSKTCYRRDRVVNRRRKPQGYRLKLGIVGGASIIVRGLAGEDRSSSGRRPRSKGRREEGRREEDRRGGGDGSKRCKLAEGGGEDEAKAKVPKEKKLKL